MMVLSRRLRPCGGGKSADRQPRLAASRPKRHSSRPLQPQHASEPRLTSFSLPRKRTIMSSQDSSPKIILVTGGGRGLGRNTAINAARSGFDVIITYHRKKD